MCELRATRQAQAQGEPGIGGHVLGPGPLHLAFVPVPGHWGAIFTLNLQVAVPGVALVQRAGVAMPSVQAIEQMADLGQQGRVVSRGRAGHGVPADRAVCVFALVEI